MARPTTHEFALLKLLATSIIFLVEEKHKVKVKFCLPYLIENGSNKEPHILWLPDLDDPFKDYVSSNEGNDKHNEGLWEKFHIEGREQDKNISIWKFITEIEECHCKEHGHIDVRHILGRDLPLDNDPNKEFKIRELNSKVLVLTTARQSCKTLIAVITLVLDESHIGLIDELKLGVEKYMDHVRKSRYLGLFEELNLPSINAAIWKSMKVTRGVNHWGDKQSKFSKFLACTEEWCKQLKLDFSGDFNESDRADESHGRPSLKDVLSIQSSEGRIQGVIERRVRSVIGENSRVKWMVGTEVKLYDYLWFNALAVAECFIGAIRGYEGLLNETNRVTISNYYKAHPFVFMHLRLLKEPKVLEVQIYEPGLEGELAVVRTGDALKGMVEPAINAGAVNLMFFLNDKSLSILFENEQFSYKENKLPPPFSGFSGLTFIIEYEHRSEQEITLKELRE